MNTANAAWTVGMTKRAGKGKTHLLPKILFAFMALFKDLQQIGPVLPRWSHYRKIPSLQDTCHCHLNKGKPTYVVLWRILNKKKNLMEIYYVGTHKNAPY